MGKELFEVLVKDTDRLPEGQGDRASGQERSPPWFEEALIELGE